MRLARVFGGSEAVRVIPATVICPIGCAGSHPHKTIVCLGGEAAHRSRWLCLACTGGDLVGPVVVRTDHRCAHDGTFSQGSIFVGAGSWAVFAGRTSGSGSFPGSGTVEFSDGFSPGSSPTEVSFGGDVVLGPSSATLMELSGTEPGEYDRLLVAGVLDVAGGLEIELLDDFIPTLDDAF